MALVSQAAYGRHRGISRVAVHLRTVTKGGPIPVHGPKKLIDVAEADALWEATMSRQGVGRALEAAESKQAAPERAPSVSGTTLAQARAAALVVDVQTKRLVLEQRRGALISRDRALLKCFAFARTLRDACLTWPGRIGPQLAATFELDAAAVTVYVEDHVRQLLTELASERVDF
jgi:hypothetical protein